MERGELRRHFVSAAAKRLSAVECDPHRSHQRELNGVACFREILGVSYRDDARFLYLDDDEETPILESTARVTWYDARAENPDRTEYRLYFAKNDVMDHAAQGDVLFLCADDVNNLTLIVAPGESTTAAQLAWLLGIDVVSERFTLLPTVTVPTGDMAFVAQAILDRLGYEPVDRAADAGLLDLMLHRFGGGFPSTAAFSAFARETAPAGSDDPDELVVHWVNHEHRLFRILERHLLEKEVSRGFESVDGFLKASLSVQNRRKSRAGRALESHLDAIFRQADLTYTRHARTEGQSVPDFLFPGEAEYHDEAFPAARLLMLGAKTTCKDRWRQVLNEAARIQTKHLVTLEPAISVAQVDEMVRSGVALVVPAEIAATYPAGRRPMCVAAFIETARSVA